MQAPLPLAFLAHRVSVRCQTTSGTAMSQMLPRGEQAGMTAPQSQTDRRLQLDDSMQIVGSHILSCTWPLHGCRTCYEQSINSTNGWGCVGQGVNVFATPLGCCNYLTSQGAIDADAGK
jgi:hypothetical protein